MSVSRCYECIYIYIYINLIVGKQQQARHRCLVSALMEGKRVVEN